MLYKDRMIPKLLPIFGLVGECNKLMQAGARPMSQPTPTATIAPGAALYRSSQLVMSSPYRRVEGRPQTFFWRDAA
jgi:hypothetical protein